MGEFRFYDVILLDHADTVQSMVKMFPNEPGYFLVSDKDVESREHVGDVATLLDLSKAQALRMLAYDSSGASLRSDPMDYIDPIGMANRQKRNPTGLFFGPDKPIVYSELCDLDRWQERRSQLEREYAMKLRVNVERFRLHREQLGQKPEDSMYFTAIHGWRIDERIKWYEAMRSVVGDLTDGLAVPGAPHHQVVPNDRTSPKRVLRRHKKEYLALSCLLPRYLGQKRVHVFAQSGIGVLPLMVYLAEWAYDFVSCDSTKVARHDVPNKVYRHPDGRFGHDPILLGRKHVHAPDFGPPNKDYPQCDCDFCKLTYGVTAHLAALPTDDQEWLKRRFDTNVYDLARDNAIKDMPGEAFIRLLTVHNMVVIRREIDKLKKLAKSRDEFRQFLADHKLDSTLAAVKLVDQVLAKDRDLGAFVDRVRKWEEKVGIADPNRQDTGGTATPADTTAP